MKNLTASDRKSLIRLASSLPQGDKGRRAILAGLNKVAIYKLVPSDQPTPSGWVRGVFGGFHPKLVRSKIRPTQMGWVDGIQYSSYDEAKDVLKKLKRAAKSQNSLNPTKEETDYILGNNEFKKEASYRRQVGGEEAYKEYFDGWVESIRASPYESLIGVTESWMKEYKDLGAVAGPGKERWESVGMSIGGRRGWRSYDTLGGQYLYNSKVDLVFIPWKDRSQDLLDHSRKVYLSKVPVPFSEARKLSQAHFMKTKGASSRKTAGEHPLGRMSIVHFVLLTEDYDIEEDAGNGDAFAQSLLDDPRKVNALESKALKSLSRMFGTRITKEGHDRDGGLVCKFGVRSWADVNKANDVVNRHYKGGDDQIDTGVPYMVAHDFRLYPNGVKDVFYGSAPSSEDDWVDWLSEHK